MMKLDRVARFWRRGVSVFASGQFFGVCYESSGLSGSRLASLPRVARFLPVCFVSSPAAHLARSLHFQAYLQSRESLPAREVPMMWLALSTGQKLPLPGILRKVRTALSPR